MKIFIAFLLAFFLITCTTYDNAQIYHKNFVPGNHSLLKFNGYYSDTISSPAADGSNDVLVRPVFLYANGSCFSANNSLSRQLLNTQKVENINGSWGNYLVNADTILLEKFQLIENNYVRIIMKGLISKNQIHWFARKFHREDYNAVDYSALFMSHSSKPDSTQNFTRTLKIYNK
ncbi:hypothetical protein BH09BAC5_BH09BAC5_18800 [soil metagenome]